MPAGDGRIGGFSREGDASVWVLVDNTGDGSIDYINSQAVGKNDTVNGVDTTPPPLPTGFKGASAENAIRLASDNSGEGLVFSSG